MKNENEKIISSIFLPIDLQPLKSQPLILIAWVLSIAIIEYYLRNKNKFGKILKFKQNSH